MRHLQAPAVRQDQVEPHVEGLDDLVPGHDLRLDRLDVDAGGRVVEDGQGDLACRVATGVAARGQPET